MKSAGISTKRWKEGRGSEEANALYRLEQLGIPTVYKGIRQIGNKERTGLQIIMKKISGTGSKNIIGTKKNSFDPPKHQDKITENTINDLLRINRILIENKKTIGDFQFIIEDITGKVFINDPTEITNRNPHDQSVKLTTKIINKFIRIFNDRHDHKIPELPEI